MRRGALVAIGGFVVAGLVTVALAAGTADAASGAQRVPWRHVDADLEVFMDVGATPQQLARVERAIRRTPEVEHYGMLDTGDAYAEFQRLFVRDPGMVVGIVASDLPRSFRLDVSSRAASKKVRRALSKLAGVDQVNLAAPAASDALRARLDQRCASGEYAIYLAPGSAPATLDAARLAIQALTASPVRFVDQAAELANFRAVHPDWRSINSGVTADMLPSSFRVVLGAHPAPALLQRLRDLDGVTAVASPDPGCDDLPSDSTSVRS